MWEKFFSNFANLVHYGSRSTIIPYLGIGQCCSVVVIFYIMLIFFLKFLRTKFRLLVSL